MDRDQAEPEVMWVDEPALVDAALRSPDLVPPAAPASIGLGATAALRAAMARFSHGDAHTGRRRDVVNAIDTLDDYPFLRRAAEETKARPGVESEKLQFTVPTLVLAESLGFAASTEAHIHVEAVVEVIGRGQPATPQADAGVDWLVDQLRAPGLDEPTVAMISLLYQNYDATAALYRATMAAIHSGAQRKNALEKTARVDPRTGMIMTLSLGAPEHEFGAGPHRCPGQRIAEAIVAGMVIGSPTTNLAEIW